MILRFSNIDERIARARSLPIEAGLLGRTVAWKNGARGVERCGPCPVCGGDDRFSINLRKQVWNCRGCARGGRDAVALAMHVAGVDFLNAVELLVGTLPNFGATFQGNPAEPIRVRVRECERTKKLSSVHLLWGKREPLEGSIAERYLREVRGLAGPFPPTLAFLPARAQHVPTMIGAYGLATETEPACIQIASGVITAVHLTRLLPDGSGKMPGPLCKITYGLPIGSPIVLAPPNDLLSFVITEGIEDGLSLHEATRLGGWVAGSAAYMPALADVVPDYIDFVTISGHPDETGVKNARELSSRLMARGIRNKVIYLGAEARAP
jgi:hypothetical protein